MLLLYLFFNPLFLEHPLLLDELLLFVSVPLNDLPLTVQVLFVPDLEQLPIIVLIELLELVIKQIPQLVLLHSSYFKTMHIPPPQ
jgi:hypothetical protein